MFQQLFFRCRFAIKLTFAVLLALFLGFHFHLETPRWAVLTAAIVASGPAFAAGGEPFAGAIRHRGMLRIIGTLIGCLGAVVIVTLTIRAPVVMLLLSCIWTGTCMWISSLVRVQNSYALGLAGYTALIIIVSIQSQPQVTPQFAIERCSEIVMGIVCAILADILFSPRSIKKDIDRAVDQLLLDQYRLFLLCINNATKEEIDKSWGDLVKFTIALDGMRANLMMESAHWQRCNRRLRAMNTLSLMLITQACETFLLLQRRPDLIKPQLLELFNEPVDTVADIHKRMKLMRQTIANTLSKDTPQTLYTWVGTATRYLLLSKGVKNNTRITKIEEQVLVGQVIITAPSAERHRAMINGLRTGVATALGCLFWLWTGWTSGSSCMVMIAVVTSLSMRLPNPLMVCKDFMIGMAMALPIGALYYMVIMPATQQSMLLLCISLGVLAFIIGIEVQKRRLGSLGTLAGTINVLVLANPMTFSVNFFLDSAIGQLVGCGLATLVILLIRDSSKARIGRVLLNRFVYGAVSALSTNKTRRQENHLPALYQQLFQLLTLFPADIAKYRLALTLIITHQRLRMADIPANADLSAFHRQIRATADRVLQARNELRRGKHFNRLLDELTLYQQKLVQYQATTDVTEPVQRLADTLQRYRHALSD
ncbi:p-hydroxybenzoic acid efflux pump subunit AaeB [Acerihabitans sp. TG2]|uniref:p-hydroxybenzoic acid efflux pump subunit AaeB n=1 Tax=Acerihabitans sp. TG2 TaxID=3096008 RepID=UPI002B23E3BA|nr:p-hydroxybenzoic acid efflux pump subunit AaeB [Acerihabitans sp. TG2]MEA9390323.1 p-hydroxybenzoic acid efflux pump subunit AaeB [Acerihabitans sp. TG2]